MTNLKLYRKWHYIAFALQPKPRKDCQMFLFILTGKANKEWNKTKI